MARTVFDCLGLMTTGVTPYTTLDARSGVGLTNPVGQMAFFGSSDNSGPLGMVFQHFCSNGVCRSDITSTRYGISGNDLSLNVDSTDPNTGGGLYIQYRGGVGIGTSNPTTHNGRGFVVRGTASDTRGIIELWDGGASGGKSVIQQVGGDTYIGQLGKGTGEGRVYFLTGGSGTSATISMTILCAGNVGINTTTPSTKLHVCNPVNQAYSPTSFNSDLHAIHIQFCNQNQRAGLIRFTSHGNLENTFGVVQVGCAAAGCGQGDFVFQAYKEAGGASYRELMRLTNTGNIGIGTSSPSSRLDVCGADGRIQSRVDSSDGSTINVRPNAGKCGWISYTEDAVADRWGIGVKNGDAKLYFASGNVGVGGGTTRMILDGSGNLGVGTTSPIDKLEVAGGIHTSGTAAASKACTGYLDYYVGQVRLGITGPNITSPAIFRIDQYSSNASIFCTPFYITETSNIGVNTTSPSYRLHVNGTFYAAGSSIKYKEGICNYDTDSCLFMCLKPVTYQYKDEFKHLGKELKSETQIGLIAEDVAEVMPELAVLVNEEDEKVVRNVDYEKLSIVLLAEVQKLRKEVDDLKNK